MGKLINKIAEKATKGIDNIAEKATKGIDNITAEKTKNAVDDVKTSFSPLEDHQEIEYREYSLDAPDELNKKFLLNSYETENAIDPVLRKIENIAFKHQLYSVGGNYRPVFPLAEIKTEKSENNAFTTDSVFKIKTENPGKCIRGLIVKKIVFTKDEYQIDKLNNVFSSMAELGSAVAICFNRTVKDCTLTFLIKAGAGEDTSVRADNSIETIENVLCGNFPGTKCNRFGASERLPKAFSSIPEVSADGNDDDGSAAVGALRRFRDSGVGVYKDEAYCSADFLDEILCKKNSGSIAVLTGVPDLKSEDSKYINQGIEKLLDGVKPDSEKDGYTLLLLAEPLSPFEVSNIKGGYEQLASVISPFQGFQFNQSLSYGQTRDKNTSESLNDQYTIATNYALGVGAHADASASFGKQSSTNTTIKDGNFGKRVKDGTKRFASGGEKLAGTARGENLGANVSAGVNAHADIAKNIASGKSYGTTLAIGLSENQNKSDGVTYQYTSLAVKNIFERLDKEIKRLETGESSGLWRFAGYVISGSHSMAQRVADIYLGLIQGEESAVERPSVNIWNSGTAEFNAIRCSLLNLEHPLFKLNDAGDDSLPPRMYCTTELNSSELAMMMNLPQKAVAGLPVIECAPFGRNVYTLSGSIPEEKESIRLGSLYHMLNEDCNNPVLLNKNKLTSHLFVTGSTGAGKSNTIYKLIENLTGPRKTFRGEIKSSADIHFMVIEPTKGEYKHVFGGWKNIKVYGTNPNLSELLKINPFAFPVGHIHVLEHIERLVEIFNACWPMYAAMPAILKESIEQSYQQVGWDLDTSENPGGKFPTFWELMDILPKTISKSNYSADTGSDYIGALVTRVNSLTTGLNGTLFNSFYNISDGELFENDVIIDLSNVGSLETKSLIMGLLILKLQEYHIDSRLSSPTPRDNESLKHLTVLEEAHHILKKTSTEQSQEGANLQGKSVEMLTNAIAEMRTYGESFIIADQAPDLLEPAVIRNTNTKIVLRLPDERDRELVGKSMALEDEQIKELAKLPNWVAAVYQSDWLEAVLCKIDELDNDLKKPYVFCRKKKENALSCFLRKIYGLKSNENRELDREELLRTLFDISDLTANDKNDIGRLFRGEKLSDKERRLLIYNILNGHKYIAFFAEGMDDIEQGLYYFRRLAERINREFDLNDKELCRRIIDDFIGFIEENKKLIGFAPDETEAFMEKINNYEKIKELSLCR